MYRILHKYYTTIHHKLCGSLYLSVSGSASICCQSDPSTDDHNVQGNPLYGINGLAFDGCYHFSDMIQY
jgi:hypothetical protein